MLGDRLGFQEMLWDKVGSWVMWLVFERLETGGIHQSGDLWMGLLREQERAKLGKPTSQKQQPGLGNEPGGCFYSTLVTIHALEMHLRR